MRCNQCHALMEEGFLSVKDGLNWLRNHDSGAGTRFAEGIPGTHAVMRPNRLTGWRCRKCELVLFAYGNRHEAEQRELARQEAIQQPESTEEEVTELESAIEHALRELKPET